ncbi:MAG: hypothetical protein ACE5I1_16480, partial [bacterium]
MASMWFTHQSKLRYHISIFISLIFPIFFAQGLFAQNENSGLILEGGLVGSPEVLLLTNFNLLQSPGSADIAPIFRVTISTTRTDTCQVKLRFTFFSKKFDVNVVEVETLPFAFHQQNSPKSITNVDITTSSVDPDIRLDFLRYDAQIASELQQDILRIGKLPSDRYILTVELIKLDSPIESPQPIVEVIDVTVPTTIDLFGPGMPVSNDYCPDVFTTFPQFSWTSNADKFILTICQVQDGNASPEDVMQNEPRARLMLQRGIDFLGTPSILYPSVGVWPLVEGQTYYWQVQTVSETPGGEVLLPSEIWCFRIVKMDDITRRLMSSGIENILRALFAGTPYEDLLKEGGPLDGHSATGSVKFNGREIDLFDLISLLKQANSGNLKITGANVE